MGRKRRIQFRNALYHVHSRGNDRKNIFYDNRDKAMFFRGLGTMCELFDITVYAFVLMDNHYHLLLRTKHLNLSKSMQWFSSTYTRRFNLRHKRCGHVFQGRFKSIIVENYAYMMQLSLYIHRNPLRARIVDRLISYKWSSYRYYAFVMKKKPPWLNISTILGRVEGDDKHRGYRDLVQQYSDEKKNIWEDIRYGIFFGSERFVEKMKTKFEVDQPGAELFVQKQKFRDSDLKQLSRNAVKSLGYELNEFKIHSRIPESLKEDRDIILYLLWNLGKYTNREIGEIFNLSYSSVSRRVNIMKQKLKTDSTIQARLQKLKSQINA